MHAPLAWDGVPELTEILEVAPLAFVHALGRALGKPTDTAPKAGEVAMMIDELDIGPKAGVRLVEACVEARAALNARPRAERSKASLAALRVSLAWLPRRYGDGTHASLVAGRGDPASQGYCPDGEVATEDPTMTDVHVSALDGVPSEVVPIEGRKSGDPSLDFKGRRRVTEVEAVLAEMGTSQDLGETVAKGLAKQFLRSTGNQGVEYQLAAYRNYLKTLRNTGDPRYLVADAKKLSEPVLKALKRYIPALRLVTSSGSTDAYETEILPILWRFLTEAFEQE